MGLRRAQGDTCRPPFPMYQQLTGHLLTAHAQGAGTRDATVAHVLGTCAGYAYSDLEAMVTIMARLGLPANGCACITQTVDAMFIFSTAYLVQSQCGRVVILSYRGTEPATLANWLGDADVGSETIGVGQDHASPLRVHAGFHRNMRATRWAVLHELDLALQGRSLANPEVAVSHPLEALYVAGHSLGGAMAVLFALTLDGDGVDRAVAERLRAVYTFGQPLVVCGPLPPSAAQVGEKLFRHVSRRDPVPALPPATWGKLAHFGHEYRYAKGSWELAEAPTRQLAGLLRLLLGSMFFRFFGSERRRASRRYSMADHGPHCYASALRPKGGVTEYGDRGPSETTGPEATALRDGGSLRGPEARSA